VGCPNSDDGTNWPMTNHKYSITGEIKLSQIKLSEGFVIFFSFSILKYVDKKDPMHRLGGGGALP
jgi:hypothetical protein